MSKTNENMLASLLKIGDVRGTGKGPGEGSSSRAAKEGGSETVAVEDVVEVEADPEEQLRERKRAWAGKQPAKQPEKLAGLSADCRVEYQDDQGVTSRKADFGSFRPAALTPEERNFIGFLSDLPSETEWSDMGKLSAMNLFQEMMTVYGQLGVRIAGCASVAQRELKMIGEAREVMTSVGEKDSKIAALEKAFADLWISSSADIEKLKKGYNDAIRKREIASEKAKGYREEARKLREELASKKSEEQVIAEFRGSNEYDQELSNVAAQKIYRCWIVAEKYLKTDPGATWAGFIGKYMEAEDALARGEGEPEAYVPPPPHADPPAEE